MKIAEIVNCKRSMPSNEGLFSQTVPHRIFLGQFMKSSKIGLLWKVS